MGSQTSGASAPLTVPQPPPLSPGESQPGRGRGGRRRWFGGLILIAAMAGGGYWLWQRHELARKQAAGDTARVVRTHTVSGGEVDRTIRLTGTTGAENFVSVIAPQLRGSRGDRGRGGRSGSSPSAAPTTVVQSNSSGSTGVSRATNASSSSRSGGVSSSTGSSGSSQSSGAADLGSTAGSLPGGGGGGGGNDFTLVLQNLVKAGSQVKKGDHLAEFDRQYMLLRLDDYRASVRQQQLDMVVLKANLEVSRKARQQKIEAAKGAVEKAILDLKTTPVRSEIESERFRLALEEAQANLKQVLAEVEFSDISELAAIRIEGLDYDRAALELKRATANTDRMVSRATIGGLAAMQNIFRGMEYGQVQAGDQLYPGQFFMQVVDLRSMVINATVNQADVDQLKIGAKARVRFDAYPDLELPAHVYSIGAVTKPGGMRASYFKEIPVRLKLDKMDLRVIPDLSVGVDVILESDRQAAVIAPLESVFRDGVRAKPYVFVRTPAGWERREVELGLANAIRVVVRGGLKPGDVIAQNRPLIMKE